MIAVESRRAVGGLGLMVLGLAACASNPAPASSPHPDPRAALEYLKELEGQWMVQGGDEGTFGWEFDVTSRGGVVLERLKVGTPTEMVTTYYLDGGALVAAHYCQLGNQPRLTAVLSEIEGDLHFLCTGHLAGASSHEELHMHGVHFQRRGQGLRIWMDMLEKGKVAFHTSYELVRVHG